MIAAVLAGGFGLRLRPVVSDRAKALANVRGTPFLERVLGQLGPAGIEKVVLCTGYLGDQIAAHFRDRWQGLKIIYSQESDPMGTGGALRLALPWFDSETVLVLNGDSYYRGELVPMMSSHQTKKSRLTILLSRVANCQRFGRVEVQEDGSITAFREKDPQYTGSGWVSAGVYAIQRELIEDIGEKRPFSLEKELFPSLIGHGLNGFCGPAEFIDIGTPDSYREASEFFGNVDPA